MYVYRASELGSCTRRLMLARVGLEPKSPGEKMQAVFDRGTETEQVVLAELESQHYTVTETQREIVLPINDDACVMGHIDGAVIADFFPMQKLRTLEIKRMSEAYWRVVKEGGWHVGGLMKKYLWQVSVYMIGTQRECAFVAKNGTTGELLWLYAEEPFYTAEQIRARVMQVEAMARGFTVVGDYECDQDDYPCPFYYTHATTDDREVLDGEEGERVESLAVRYADAKRRERDAKAEAKRLGAEIRAELGERDKVVAGMARVTAYTGSSTRFDWDRAREDGVDVERYRAVSSYPALRVAIDEGTSKDEHEGRDV